MSVKISDKGFSRLLRFIKSKLFSATQKGAEKGSKLVASDYTSKMSRGVTGRNKPIKPVRESTMNQPIRRGGPDRRIRRSVNPSAGVAVYATGETARSIRSKRNGKWIWEVSSATAKGDMILGVNAKELPSRNIKNVRNPLQVGKDQLDILEKEILKEIDKLF